MNGAEFSLWISPIPDSVVKGNLIPMHRAPSILLTGLHTVAETPERKEQSWQFNILIGVLSERFQAGFVAALRALVFTLYIIREILGHFWSFSRNFVTSRGIPMIP